MVLGYMADKVKTDRQTDTTVKSSRWVFTAWEPQWPLFLTMPPGIAEWGWQTEICPTTQKPHYQGYLRLHQQQRRSAVNKMLPTVHVEIPRNWDASVNYCKKEETRAPGSIPVHQTNSIPNHYQYAETLGQRYVEIYGTTDIWKTLWDHDPNVKDVISFKDRLDELVNQDIREGRRYAAWITTNPSWIAMWKSKWKPFITSFQQKD